MTANRQQGIVLCCLALMISLAGTAVGAGKSKSPQRGAVQEPAPAPWHVKQADIRFPVSLKDTWKLPCDDYLADLKAIESKGLTFDPMSKDSVKGTGGWTKGASAVYAVGPNHRWLTFFHRGGSSKVFADGKQIFFRSVYSRQTNHAKVAIPKGTSQIRIAFSGAVLHQAGLTQGPRAARAQVCLPGLNPAGFRPLVYTASGKRVGCNVIWAREGEPMTVLFDCSSGEKNYFLYRVDASHKVAPLAWKRGGGIILETRYLDRYDASAGTYDGFNRLWQKPDHIAGRILVNSPHITRLPPFPPRHSDRSMFRAPHGAPLVLSRCIGIMNIPVSGKIRIYSRFRSGGYLRIDGKMVINAGGQSNREDDTDGKIRSKKDGKDINLSMGPHLIELCQYGPYGAQYGAFSMYGMPGARLPKFAVHVDTFVEAPECRDKNRLLVFAVWPSITSHDFLQALGRWPAGNMMQLPMEAHLSKPMKDVTFRWKFPDGHEAVGQQIQHTFFEEGMYPVTVEAIGSNVRSVVASATVRIKVDVNWTRGNWGYRRFNDELTRRAHEFDSTMPINHLLNIHAWARKNYRRPMQKLTGQAIEKRIDEVLKERALQPNYLLWLGKALSTPPESAHEAALELLRAASLALEPGTIKHKQAALAICDLLTTVYNKPSEAIKLAEHAGAQKEAIALNKDWEVATDKAFHPDLHKINPREIAGKLTWEKHPELGYQSVKRGDKDRIWLRKRFNLDSRDNSKPLYLHLGRMFKDGMIYFNDQPLCEPWKCPEGMLAVPAKLLRRAENELLIHFRPQDPDDDSVHYYLAGPGKDDLDREFMKAKAVAMLSMDKLDEVSVLLKQMTEAKESTQSQPKSAVVGWHMLGPFEGNSAVGANRLPVVGLKKIDLTKPVNDKQWQQVEDRFCHGPAIDLKSLVPLNSSLLLYKSFHAPQPFDSEFEGRGGNNLTIWLNGKAILGNIGRRGRGVGNRIVHIDTGTNEILAMVRVSKPRYTPDFRLFMTNPDSEISEVSLASQLRKAKLWAIDGNPDHADASYEFLERRLNEQPPLRTNVDVMETMVRALVGRQDYRRALVLSERLLRMGVPEIYERALLLGKVRIMLGLGKLDEARKVYKQMNGSFPYSEETLKARETIIKSVMEENKKKKEGKGT